MDYIIAISFAILVIIAVYQNSKINELEACRNKHLMSVIEKFKNEHPEFNVVHPNGNLSYSNFNQYFQYTTNNGQKVIRLVNTSNFNDFNSAIQHLKSNQYEYKVQHFSSYEMPKIFVLNE